MYAYSQALAVGSGIFIGSSFVFKKKGLLAAQRKYAVTAGEAHAYLKSPMWWTGMIIMILGEVLNFVAYMFADAVLVTPMGALSVVVCAVLSAIFLKEHLTLFGKVGCFLCIVGSVIIAINAPEEKVGGDIRSYEHLFIAPGFLVWLGLCVVTALVLVFLVAPRYGKKNMLVYITVCSVIGGLSVSVTSGLGSAIILSIRGDNQFTYWFTYFLLGFVIVTLLVEINYLNKALELFNTAAVTPTYYVLFTAATIITSVILSKGLHASPVAIVTIVFGFLTICAGITLLQLSKMDPKELEQQQGLDRKSSMLLSVMEMGHELEKEHELTQIEDPGVDTIRGGMGIVGSLMRARTVRRAASHQERPDNSLEPLTTHALGHDMPRYQLYDRPLTFSPDAEHHVKFTDDATQPHGHYGDDTDLSGIRTSPVPHSLVPILENGRAKSQRRFTPSTMGLDGDVGARPPSEDHSAPAYAPDLPPIWGVGGWEGDDDKLASPTGIVDEYCDLSEEPIELHPVPLGSRSRSLQKAPSALAKFRFRKSSRDRPPAAPSSPAWGAGAFLRSAPEAYAPAPTASDQDGLSAPAPPLSHI